MLFLTHYTLLMYGSSSGTDLCIQHVLFGNFIMHMSRAGRYTNFEDSMVPVKYYSSNLSQVTSVYKQYQESDIRS